MKHVLKATLARLSRAARTQRGRNILTYGVFVLISAVLWVVLSLNEEDQVDMRMPLVLERVPDSVMIVSVPPEYVNVSLRARGTDFLKSRLGRQPALRVDWRSYRGKNALDLSSAEIKTLARAAVDGATVMSVMPDSLHLLFTTKRGKRLPVHLDYEVTAGPQVSLVGRPRVEPDSVSLYSIGPAANALTSLNTEPVRISDLDRTTTLRVKVLSPARTRPQPDSVDVTFTVEPLIVKTRSVVVEPVNVPAGLKLITFPPQVEVHYMLPASVYKNSTPQFRVVADYHELDRSARSRNIRLRLVDVDSRLQNVYLSTDSAEYIIEKL